MTITAGFVCGDGVVLCADTEEITQGYLKTRIPKLVIRPQGLVVRQGMWGVFAGAGAGPLIDKLIDKMWAAAEQAVGGLRQVLAAIEEANANYHRELATLYQPGDSYYPRCELIYAVALRNALSLQKATGPIVNTVSRFETAGGGEVLAKYIADRFYPRFGRMTVKQASILSLYLLQQTKQYAEGCGGESHVVILRSGDEPPEYVDSVKVAAATQSLWDSEKIAQRLFLAIPDLELSAEEYSKEISQVLVMITETRDRHYEFMRSFETQQIRVGRDEKKAKRSISRKSKPEP